MTRPAWAVGGSAPGGWALRGWAPRGRARRGRGASPGASDRGHVAIEAAVATTGLLLLLWLVVGGLRIVNAAGDVHASARAAARAAARARPGDAAAAARQVAAVSLGDRDIHCAGLAVDVSTQAPDGGDPGAVRVTVTCTVVLRDVALAGFPGSRQLTARAVDVIDAFRGGAS